MSEGIMYIGHMYMMQLVKIDTSFPANLTSPAGIKRSIKRPRFFNVYSEHPTTFILSAR